MPLATTTPGRTETPDPTQTFVNLGVDPSLAQVLAARDITTPTPIQRQALPPLLAGRDLIGQAQTGSGKTLAFVLPLVTRLDPSLPRVQAIVLAPTRELAIQIGDVLAPLAAARHLRWTLLYGGRGLGGEQSALRAGPQIVVATPGRTLDHLRQGTLQLDGVRVLVLDEADEMLDKGMRPDVERIISRTPRTRQTALFSATVPEWVMGMAAKHLNSPVQVQVARGAQPPSDIVHIVFDVASTPKLAVLRTLLDHRGPGSVLVFGRTKHGVKRLASQLQSLGYPAAALQGNMSQNARERVMADFRSGAVPILLATNVAARGIDVDDIGQVINFELPESAELFTHRTGRTGRMGRRGEAITLLDHEEQDKWRQIERRLGRNHRRTAWPHGFDPEHPARPAPVAPFVPPSATVAPPTPAARQPRRRAAPGAPAERRPGAPAAPRPFSPGAPVIRRAGVSASSVPDAAVGRTAAARPVARPGVPSGRAGAPPQHHRPRRAPGRPPV